MGDQNFQSALDLFGLTAARQPSAVALTYFDGILTYADLDRMSDAFAQALLDSGFAAGGRVALYLQNMPQFPIAMLGVWKAGGVAVPINPMNRVRELTLLLQDSEPHALVLTPELFRDVYQQLPEGSFRPKLVLGASPFDFQTRNDVRVLAPAIPSSCEGLTDILDAIRPFEGQTPVPVALKPEDLAYIVYTSGTTGQPKGAMILHRNVIAGAEINERFFDVREGSRILGMAPLFHVTGLMSQLNLTFKIGGSVLLSYRFDPGVMVECVREHGATHVFGAATAYIAMMNTPGASPEDMKSIRVVGSGGAPTPPAVVKLAEVFLGASVQNGYGMTETAIATHVTPRGQPIPVDQGSGALSVGPPVTGVTAWIEGPDGRPAAPGEAGEIVVSGPTITAGYWRKPEATAEAYRADGFRTGDIAVMDEKGWFYLVDRKKDMISASGFKVWPREVEDVLYAHPAVREAAVVGVADEYRGETVRAVVSLRPGIQATPDELREHCRVQLATYKVPREVRIIDELPKTPSGKILRRELRD